MRGGGFGLISGLTPLVFLPGMMCDARLFAPQIAALSGRFPILTAPLVGASNMQELAAGVLRYAPPRFAIIGLSMGGILGMEIVRQARERVAGLALLDTSPLAEREEVKAGRQPQMDAARTGDLARVMREDLIPGYGIRGPHSQQVQKLCLDMAMSLGADVFCSQSIALRERPDQRQTLSEYGGPSLVLCGESDTLCPVERHQLMSGLLPDARLVVVEDAGHLPTVEQPSAVNAALESWLARLS